MGKPLQYAWGTAALLIATGAQALAANFAFDTAANSPPYGDGWQTGDNGGFGFSGWSLNTTSGNGTQNGHFIGGNGPGAANEVSSFGTSWGLYANSGQTAAAVRPFTGGALSVGQTFSIAMDNGNIQNGGTVGLGLQNGADVNRLEFFFVGGESTYKYNNGSSSTATSIGFRDNGMRIFVTPQNATAVQLRVTSAGGTELLNTLVTLSNASDISKVRLFNFNAGGGGASNLFFDEVATPEPGSLSALAFGAVFARRRRRDGACSCSARAA